MAKFTSPLLLLLAAVIWGITFVMQSDAMQYIGPFTFNFLRCAIGALALLPFGVITEKKRLKTLPEAGKKAEIRALLTGGLLCGLILFAAMNLQQHGIREGDSVGKAGFITSLYMIFVPVIGIFFGKKTNALVWISGAVAFLGLYFLCGNAAGSAGGNAAGNAPVNAAGPRFAPSDLLYLLCAVCFALHILVISIYAPRVSGTALSCMQFGVCAVLSGAALPIFESFDIQSVLAAYVPLLYAGIMACGVAYTLQIIGQKRMDPTVATLILCLESVVSALAGRLMLHQTLTGRQILGCALMFAGTALAQVPADKFKKKRQG